MAGISFEGFAKQKDRCEAPKNTCLKNQPLDFWDADDKKRKSGGKGVYLLENYGSPYKDPIIIDKETKEHWLAIEYYDEQQTVLTIEFNADQIVALTPGRHIQISKVISSSKENKITFNVFLSNKDLAIATIFTQAIDCKFGVPDSNNVSKVVPPQRMDEFLLETTPGKIELTETFECMIVAGNPNYGVVSKREVSVKPLHRCICNMHCKCACLDGSLKCEPMEVEDYQAAGFRGSLPVLTAKPPYRIWFIAHPFLALLALGLLMLLSGLIKATFGVFGYKKISYFGLESRIFDKKQIKQYFEADLKEMEVVYDEEGHPIHPETNDPARTLSEEIIFAMNAFFLCFWPYLKFIDSRAAMKAEETLDDAATTDEEEEEEGEEVTIGETAGDESRTDESESDRPRRVEMQLGRHQVANVRPSVDEMGNPIDPGKLQRNVRSESVEETPESEPDTDVMGREQAQWQKGAHKAQAATPGPR